MQSRIIYQARISFKIEGEITIFSKKQKLKEYSNIKLILKEKTERAPLNKKEVRRNRMEKTTPGKQSIK